MKICSINQQFGFRRASLLSLALFGWLVLANHSPAQDVIDISRSTALGQPPTPIAIVGYSGEVASVLKFDLAVMGFTNVQEGYANYILSGSNDGSVIGTLSVTGDPSKKLNGNTISAGAAKTVLFSRRYEGSTMRIQAHRLADDVVLKITGVNGIAEKNGRVAKIAFKVEFGRTSEIYIADFDGHDYQPATQDQNIVAAPDWIPGHFALFYTSYKRGPLEIFRQDLESGERHRLAAYPGMVGSPAVSPDGRRVAFVLAKSGSVNIYVADIDGGNLKQLTSNKEDDSSPCWSPDGQWICYASKPSERRSLYKVPAGGGSPVRIPTSGVSSPSEPDWSPDGQWIAFTSQNSSGFDICVVPAKGGTTTVLVSGEDPSWSPNSRTLIFVRRSRGSGTLSLLDVPTKQVKDVPRVPGNGSSNSQPSWAR